MLDRLLANWPWKLLSLALAALLWIAVSGEDLIVKDYPVPIHLQLLDDRILATPPPTNAIVRLSGPESMIRELDPLDLALRLDLRDVPFGERDVHLSEVHLTGVPSRAEVMFIEPSRVRVVVDRRKRRELPVVAAIVGEPPAGFAFYQAIVEPETVVVDGPATEVDAMSHVRTDPVYVDRRTRAFVERVGAVPERPTVRLAEPALIEVRVVIDDAPVEKTFDGVAVELPGTARGVVTPQTARVTVTGPKAILAQLAASRIRAIADLAAVAEGEPRVPVRAEVVDVPVELRWRLAVKSIDPHSVSVRLSEPRSG
jgi:YbbR domain-containing protein